MRDTNIYIRGYLLLIFCQASRELLTTNHFQHTISTSHETPALYNRSRCDDGNGWAKMCAIGARYALTVYMVSSLYTQQHSAFTRCCKRRRQWFTFFPRTTVVNFLASTTHTRQPQRESAARWENVCEGKLFFRKKSELMMCKESSKFSEKNLLEK